MQNDASIRSALDSIEFMDWEFLLRHDDGRPYLQVQVDGVCNVEEGKPFKWRGRKWILSYHMTKSEIVQTAFKAVLTAMEHEARELFKYRGHSIFDPHYDVDALVELRANPQSQDERHSIEREVASS